MDQNLATKKSDRTVYLVHHQGLGDMLLCIGLYRELAKRHRRIILPIRAPYASDISQMLGDLDNVSIRPLIELPNKKIFLYFELLQMVFLAAGEFLLGRKIIALGYFGKNFFSAKFPMRFDENFYFQASVDFEKRWTSFKLNRSKEREEALYERVVGNVKEYIFLHEDASREFKIDRTRIPKGLPIIEPIRPEPGIYFSDYSKIMEQATALHVIESSFAALAEGLMVDVPKFAHRYARPEAHGDWKHEFTYRSVWQIEK